MEQSQPQQNRINLNEMSKEQIELLIQNINKEIESLRADFKNKLERVLAPIGIKFAIVLKLAENQKEIDEFVAILKGEKNAKGKAGKVKSIKKDKAKIKKASKKENIT